LASLNPHQQRRKENSSEERGLENALVETAAHACTHEQLLRATNNFATVLGKGAFATVYAGRLNGEKVAVKVEIERARRGGTDSAVDNAKHAEETRYLMKQYVAEISTLYKYRHPNVCSLLGHCADGPKRALVYEFCPNGDLAQRLAAPADEAPNFDSETGEPLHPGSTPGSTGVSGSLAPLTWLQRLRIAVGTARGLAYLHAKPSTLIHRDVKPSNILLDASLFAKLSDFGTVREQASAQQTLTSSDGTICNAATQVIVGTLAYMPNEYLRFGKISVKMDSYAFGVCIFELLTGKSASRFDLSELITGHMQDGPQGLASIRDPRALALGDADGGWPAEDAFEFARLGDRCSDPAVKTRAKVQEVLPYLEIMLQRAEKRCAGMA
jgi:serine/threonine protein kinase